FFKQKTACEFSLGLVGSGELKSGGFRRESILADAMEALIGAIYLDTGMDSARERIIAWLGPQLRELTPVDTNKDPKTRLQEFLQSRGCDLPRYEVVDIQGEPHCRTFFVDCEVALLSDKTHGHGGSRRIAEQVAAAAALVALIGAVAMWSSEPKYNVLCSNLDDRDGGAIVTALGTMNVPYKYNDTGTALLVPADRVYDARL
ncbi:ribonuclease III family protein, partial [Achromobacter xylosoxidans]